MATQTAKAVSLDTNPNTPVIEAFQGYSVGDRCYYSYNGLSIPCLVVNTKQRGVRAATGYSTVYTVAGDITTNQFPSGYPQGPFKNVSFSALSARP